MTSKIRDTEEIESRHVPDRRPEKDSLSLPDFVFDPGDDWTRVFQEGLSRLSLSRKNVYEVGLGSGSNVAFLLNRCSASRVAGSDIDARVVRSASANVKRWAPEQCHNFAPINGSVDLLDSAEARAAASNSDFIIGSIPQVIDVGIFNGKICGDQEQEAKGSRPPRLPDHIAHYYDGTRFEDYPFNAIGQGLNEALLRQAREVAPHAEVILVLSGRVGPELLLQLFRDNGYRPEVVYEEIVPQCPKTSISFFVELEAGVRDPTPFWQFNGCFYADPEGKEQLSAAGAQKRRDAVPSAQPVYHKLYVIKGGAMGLNGRKQSAARRSSVADPSNDVGSMR